jgi:hypothetical protein
LHSAKAKKFVRKAKKVLIPTLAPLAMSQRNNYIAAQQNIIAGSALGAKPASPRRNESEQEVSS